MHSFFYSTSGTKKRSGRVFFGYDARQASDRDAEGLEQAPESEKAQAGT